MDSQLAGHITNYRAMEIFRDLGIENQVGADATLHELVSDTVLCTSISDENIGRWHRRRLVAWPVRSTNGCSCEAMTPASRRQMSASKARLRCAE